MPEMVLHRTHVVRSLNGSSVKFEAGKPCYVPPQLVADAVAAGAQLVNGQPVDVLPGETLGPVMPADINVRKEQYSKAFVALVALNARLDFTGTGIPTVKAVEKRLGWEPHPKELKQMWAEWKEAKALADEAGAR